MKNNNFKKITRLIFGLVFAFVLIYYVFRNVNFGEVLILIKGIKFEFLIPAVLIVLFLIPYRGLRWFEYLNIIKYKPKKSSVIKLYGSGVFLNLTLFANVGDLFRLVESKKLGMNRSRVLSTIYFERLFDLILMFSLMLLTLPFAGFFDKQIQNLILIISVLVILLVSGAFFIIFAEKFGKKIIKILFNLPFIKNYEKKLEDMYDELVFGFKLFWNKKIFLIFLMSLSLWMMESLVFYFVCKSLSMNTTFLFAVFMTISANLFFAIPISPSGLGLVDSYLQIVLSQLFLPELATAVILVYRSMKLIGEIGTSFMLFTLRQLESQ